MIRPRAADDFPAIRARLEELRREHAPPPANADPPPDPPRVESARPDPVRASVRRGPSPAMRRALWRRTRA
ncbi:MAG TPA: hypothetical protein VND95_01645 [Stellaceae bacterium]|nr:hypothetical protein [Stellaceae bacterium]